MNLSIKDEMTKEINAETRAAALQILRGVVLATPVDTGRAKGNWQVSVSSPIKSESENLDRTGGSTINHGASVINSEQGLPVFWLSNNLDYIEDLNNGTSKQAPAKFVESVIKRVINDS